MHIPAMDSLRQERVGIVSEDGAIVVLKAHVQTDDTDERGAYDPVEGFARPFPMMIHSDGRSVSVERLVMDGELQQFSETLIEYVSLLYDSMMDGEWVEELDEFDDEPFSAVEQEVASSLMQFATADIPQELFRTVYESAGRYEPNERDLLRMNSLADVEGHERYGFEYLPEPSEVDAWQLLRYMSDFEVEGEDENAVSESLWVRYTVGDTEHERPIVGYQNDIAGLTASSESVDFGTNGQADVTEELVEAILSDESSDVDSHLTDVSPSEFEGTRTLAYLEAYLSE